MHWVDIASGTNKYPLNWNDCSYSGDYIGFRDAMRANAGLQYRQIIGHPVILNFTKVKNVKVLTAFEIA